MTSEEFAQLAANELRHVEIRTPDFKLLLEGIHNLCNKYTDIVIAERKKTKKSKFKQLELEIK